MSSQRLPRLHGVRPAPHAAASSALGVALLVAFVALLAAPALVLAAVVAALAVLGLRRVLARVRGRRPARDARPELSPQ